MSQQPPDEEESLASVPVHDRPRERMRRLGVGSLTDDEVLALVLGSGQSGKSVRALARSILRRTGGFPGLATMDFARLETLPGVGPATAGRLVAIIEIWRRAGASSAWTRLVDDKAIADIVRPELLHRDSERFLVVVADRAARPLELVLLSDGGVDDTRIQPADVLQPVITRGGRSFAVAHNHPSGVIDASVADLVLTRRLDQAAATIGLRFLGHILVAGDRWSSITASGSGSTGSGASVRGTGRSSHAGSRGAA
ncbi:JAB domain-containing protein [Leifsonia sp. 71-9]|uniref:JAB domain-containing protein n=1 Tax=Leifsonia sp. 71-9 TaxID=1895934 RepID=UPI0025BE7E2F|nr:JAB domain-containing protein [Leifsonia sp. 71-9]